MALTKTQVSELYVAIFNRASEGEGNQFWQGAESVAAAATDMLASAPAQEYFGSALDSSQAFIEHIYLNTFGKTVADDPTGIQFWVDALEGGQSRGEIVAGIVQAATDPVNAGAAQDQFLNRIAVSNYTSDNLPSVDLDTQEDAVRFDRDLTVTSDSSTVDSAKTAIDDVADGGDGGDGGAGDTGDTLNLTDGRDVLNGTADNDTFNGLVGQNQIGSIANAFGTGDVLDGGAGRDKIVASMQDDFEVGDDSAIDVRPYTKNIEEVYIEAIGATTPGGAVVLDATRMENVEQFWSDFSGSGFAVTNVNLQGSNLNITKDVTFGIKDTAFNTDFTATFDSQSLLAAPEEAANSQLEIQIADVSTQTPSTPLANVSLTLGFELGGESFVIENIVSTTGTYQGLVIALEAAFAAQGLGNLNVALSSPYTSVTVAGNTVNLPFTAQEILVTDPDGNTFAGVDFTQAAINSVPGGFLVAGTADPVDPTVSGSLIESNLVLDNAGRGSTAGDVAIGGESNSLVGVEQFNVFVDRGSKIASLKQTGTNASQLEQIVIGSTAAGANGSLFIGEVDSDLNVINASAFQGEALSIGDFVRVSDLVMFNSAGSNTDVTLVADYDGDGRASDAQAFTINTGSGNDTITADLDGTSTSNSTTASLTINSTGGDNTVLLTSDLNDAESNTATVVLGGGTDVVTGGSTNLVASTGGSNDVIYAENTGVKTTAVAAVGDFVGTVGTTAMGTGTTVVNNIQLLGGRQVQVTLGLPDDSSLLAAGFTDGLEVTADIVASNGLLTTERDLYNAVAKAINEDAVLNKLADAGVDSNGNLIVKYKIDGDTAGGDQIVEIEVLEDSATALSGTAQSNLLQALKEAYNDSTITSADVVTGFDSVQGDIDYANVTVLGTDSILQGGVNVVNGGQGNDVIVLSSDNVTNDTVVFDAGQFGNDTIVHFEEGATGDVLDFNAWMSNKSYVFGSTSAESQIDIATALNTAPGAISASDVTVVDFSVLPGLAPGVTFENMTDAQVLGSLTSAGGFTVGATAGLVGTTQNSILMVQNQGTAVDNEGEYKVYEVVSDNVAGENFISATLVGSVDFGEEQAFNLANFA